MTVPPDATGPAAAPAPGSLLAGRYRLERRVGRGATAEVWAAVDESLRRPVAVKLPIPETGPAALEHLRAEAAAAGRITDPAVVAVYDYCNTTCGEALVLELVDGATFRETLDRRGRLPVTEALRVGAGIARALDAVHRAGLVHRDVKPGNVLLVEDRVKLSDFGAAAPVGSVGRGRTGTPKYIAPEQLEGAGVDHRADLYALGAVLYEAIAGRPPFLERDESATATARLHRDPSPLTELRADAGPEVAALVHRLLERDPDLRPATAEEAALALDAAAGAWTEPTDRLREVTDEDRSGWWIPMLVLVLVVAFSVGVAVLLFSASDGTPRGVVVDPADEEPDPVPTTSDGTLFPPVEETGRILSATAVDPFGDGAEHDEEAPFLLDGDEATGWSTELYRTPDFGGLKPGLGLVLAVGPAVESIVVRSSVAGWSALVLQSATASGDDPSEWGEPIESIASAGAEVEFPVRRGGGDVLLWFTGLAGPPGEHQVVITEIVPG